MKKDKKHKPKKSKKETIKEIELLSKNFEVYIKEHEMQTIKSQIRAAEIVLNISNYFISKD